MKSEVIFEKGSHKWVAMGRDKNKLEEVIDTNEYLIIHDKNVMLLDPGGTAIFPSVLTELTKYASTDDIKTIVASHQDPDIASSLAMWLDLCPDLKVYCPWTWTGFISHFGMGSSMKLEGVPDDGMELPIGNTRAYVYLVPAHYCHASGNFHVYDPIADILFTGDMGAALLPPDYDSLYVEDFDEHLQYMEAFHRRWMPSSEAIKAWVKRVRVINPNMLCPQHGAIFRGDDVKKFLDWIENVQVGKWNNQELEADIYSTPWMKWKKGKA